MDIDLKKDLQFRVRIGSIKIGTLKDIKPANWADTYLNYLKRFVEDLAWNLESGYLFRLISSLVDTFKVNLL